MIILSLHVVVTAVTRLLLPGGCRRLGARAQHAGALSVAVSFGSEVFAMTRLTVQRSVVLGDCSTLKHLVASLCMCTHTSALSIKRTAYLG